MCLILCTVSNISRCLHFPIGGWELIGIPQDTAWTLDGEQFFQEKLFGSTAFFDFGISVDDKNSSRFVLVVRNTIKSAKPSFVIVIHIIIKGM